MKELKVGQKVVVLKIGNAARYYIQQKKPIEDRMDETEIVKVGNKFFYLKGYDKYKFSRKSFYNVSDYSADFCVYFNKQEIYDEIEFNSKLSEIRKFFGRFGSVQLTKEQIYKIYDIIFKSL